MIIQAKYKSKCCECNCPIEVGDDMLYEDSKAYCIDCAQDID